MLTRVLQFKKQIQSLLNDGNFCGLWLRWILKQVEMLFQSIFIL
jgi:hypothetical protein